MLTLTDLTEKLKLVDEVSLLEVLNITAEEIVDRFADRVEERFDYLNEEFDESNYKDE